MQIIMSAKNFLERFQHRTARSRKKLGQLQFLPIAFQPEHIMDQKVIAAVQRMQKLGDVVTAVAVNARFTEAAARVNKLEKPRHRVVKNVGEAQVAVDDLAARAGGQFLDARLDCLLN